MSKKKTQLEELDRGIYDIKNEVRYSYKTEIGLNEDIVRRISEKKNEPEWMLKIRLKALEIYNKTENPTWGPDLSEVDMEKIIAYMHPDTEQTADWNDIPDDIRETFDKLGIPEAEKQMLLSGVGVQYDSEVVYHKMQERLSAQGVIYTDFESGVREYPEIIQQYFTKALSPELHKYMALHYAVWSGGSFVYVPSGVSVTVPLQSYFRMNAPGTGQFEHTLIVVEEDAYCHFIEGCSAPKYSVVNVHAGGVELFVKKNSTLRYTTIENWSRNMYNLNSKRAIVEEDATIEWVSGSFGSKVSMLYPSSILRGENARAEFTSISFAGANQVLDTGQQTVHLAPNTLSTSSNKSISKNGGVCVFRSLVKMGENSQGSKSTTSCESLMLDSISRSDTIPVVDIKNDNIDFGHEAKIGRISDEAIFYLNSRGLNEEEAKGVIVRGFAEPISKELPMEYAVEMNTLITLELEGSIG